MGYALLHGLAGAIPAALIDDLKVFTIAPEPPPPPVEKTVPVRAKQKAPEGAASPKNLKSKATEIVAPPPIVRVIVPPPIVAAPKPGVGTDASTGASDVPGPGTGSGGQGTGTGSGRGGDGDGGWADETPPRLRSGRLRDSDYPSGLGEAGVGGTVSVRYLVGTNGRVSQCTVTRSSGNAELDTTTCRLIEQRFRFAPSRDANGTAVPSFIVENHAWAVEDEEAPPVERRFRR